jgi:TetR/AcrR family tetracycline transcriptional repressor
MPTATSRQPAPTVSAEPTDLSVRGVMTEDMIVRAALGIIEEYGVDGLTMRLLSARLDVALGATYHRVPNKHALLVLVAKDLYSRVEFPATDVGDWKTQVHSVLLSVVDVLSGYPGMAAYISRHMDDMAPVDVAETLQRTLFDAGFDQAGVDTALSTLFFYVAGTLVGGFTSEPSPFDASREQVRDQFARGLDVVLRGIEVALRASQP